MISSSGKALACAREPERPRPVDRPDPPAPPSVSAPIVAAMAADGIDAELVGLTADQLRAKIDELEPLTRDPRVMTRIKANTTRVAARGLLERWKAAASPRPRPRWNPSGRCPSSRQPQSQRPRRRTWRPLSSSAGWRRRPARRSSIRSWPDCARGLIPTSSRSTGECCRRVLAGDLPVGDVIGAFRWAMNAPDRGVKKGPSFAAYLSERADRAAEKQWQAREAGVKGNRPEPASVLADPGRVFQDAELCHVNRWHASHQRQPAAGS